MNKAIRYSAEFRERAVGLVLSQQDDHKSQWAAIRAIAEKLGCTPETLRSWVRKKEQDTRVRSNPTDDAQERLKALERENRELKRSNEILRKAAAFFAQAELDRKPK